MGIRIQPRQLEIPDDEPFKNDLLGRRESAEILTNLIGNMEGPCVLAVDAAWGTGKTTFLDMWRRHLRNEGFTVVHLNAWETDFTGNPFLAISSEIAYQLEDSENQSLADRLVGARTAAVEVARRATPAIIRLATAGVLDLSPLIEKEIGQALGSAAEDRLSRFKEDQASLSTFRDSLSKLAKEVTEECNGRPLVIVIDELDRCRPSYAVELLEVAKHLFSVDHIVFVLAVNRSQLSHSIKAIYGEEFDSNGYLGRFLDIDFLLPEVDKKSFILSKLQELDIESYFERTLHLSDRKQIINVKRLLAEFLDNPDLSLRRIEQSLHRLCMLFGTLDSDKEAHGIAATLALILRTYDQQLYNEFLNGGVNDLEISEIIFKSSGMKKAQEEPEGNLLEAFLILACLEIQGPDSFAQGPQNSALWQKYQDELTALSDLPYSKRKSSINQLSTIVTQIHSERWNWRGIGFRIAVDRLELISTDLNSSPTLSD